MKILIVVVLCLICTSTYVLNELEPIIQFVNSQKTTWTAGHNHYFDGRTMEQIKSLMGVLETPEELKLPEKDIIAAPNVPDQFFSAQQWPNCQSIQEVWDQSACGSCWAFGAAQAMSDRICIASNQQVQTRISAEDINTCCTSCGMGCNGGYPSAAWSYWRSPGVVTGWYYNTTNWCSPYAFPKCDHHVDGPYGPCGSTHPTPACKRQCVQGYPIQYDQDRWQASSVYSVPSSVDKIQTEIMTHGPVEAAFTVYQDFLTYRSGVYQHTSGSALGGHAIKILGWGVLNGTPYWYCANSWNEGWGDKGFFRIRRGNNECGIEGQIVAGIPIIKEQVVSE